MTTWNNDDRRRTHLQRDEVAADLLTKIDAAAARIYFQGRNLEVLEVAASGRKWLESLGADADVDDLLLVECRRILREVESYEER